MDTGLEYGAYPPEAQSTWPYSNIARNVNLRAWYDGAWHLWPYSREYNGEKCHMPSATSCFTGDKIENRDYEWTVSRRRPPAHPDAPRRVGMRSTEEPGRSIEGA